jgi:hypothetical protein
VAARSHCATRRQRLLEQPPPTALSATRLALLLRKIGASSLLEGTLGRGAHHPAALAVQACKQRHVLQLRGRSGGCLAVPFAVRVT